MTEPANEGGSGRRVSGGRHWFGRVMRAGTGKLIGYALIAIFAYQLWDRIRHGYGTSWGAILTLGLAGLGLVLLTDRRGEIPASAAVPRERPPRSPLFLLTISVLLVVVGFALGLGATGVVEFEVGQLSALALLIVGSGLVLGAFAGRARWLILLGILLVPVVLATSFIPFTPYGYVGSRYLYADDPRILDEIDGHHRVLFGDLNIDLVDIEPEDFGDRRFDIEMAAGNLNLYLPHGIALTVIGSVEAGDLTVGRGYQSGTHLFVQESLEGLPEAGSLTLRVQGGLASVYVERISYRERYGMTRKEAELRAERRRERRREQRAEARRDRGDRPKGTKGKG